MHHDGGQQFQRNRLLAEYGRVDLDRLLVGGEHVGHEQAAVGQRSCAAPVASASAPHETNSASGSVPLFVGN